MKNKRILIDSNVLIYCADKELGQEAKKLLRKLKDNGNDLATSEICCLEVLRGAVDLKLREYFIKLINYIHKIPIERPDIVNASILGHIYQNQKLKAIKSTDLLIGAIVLRYEGSLLLTENRIDFPMPFWKKIEHCHLIGKNKKGEGEELHNIFLLEFDHTLIPKEYLKRRGDV